ncbi:hypothetical protein ACFQ08_13980 [Streptosporangium algeriense]|uniref:Uncharacterized protein n=1 Tax=Streptosporangium algeriense TaxID=1682748 RepID=A0ABW3DR60_9ACTN
MISALGLVSGALVVLPSVPASANSAELVVDYRCTGGPTSVASHGPVNLRTTVTVPTTLTVGEPLNVKWTLGYKGDPGRFGSPDYFAAGGKVTVTGHAQLSGVWNGILLPSGSMEQPELSKDGVLKLPESISDSAHTDRAGKLRVTPQQLFVDFTPPAGETMVNDDSPRVQYTGVWKDRNDQPPNNNDHHYDIHRTVDKGSRAALKFTGTGIEYVAQRDHRAGRVLFYIDGQPATPAFVDASKNPDGTPSNDANRGGQTLWQFHGLKYGEHLVEVVNDEQGKWAQLDAFRVITEELPEPPQEHRATCTLVSAPVSVDVTISSGSTPTSTNSQGPGGTPTCTSAPHPATPTCHPTTPIPTCSPTPNPTPYPTCLPTTPIPTCTPGSYPATPTCHPTTPIPTCSPTPNPTPYPTCRPATPTPTCRLITPTPTPTGTPAVTPTPTPTCAPTPRPTPTQSGTHTSTATSTSTPKPTLTVTATVTPTRPTPTVPQVVITPSGGAQTGEAPDGPPSAGGLIGAGAAMVLGSAWGGVVLRRRRAAHVRDGQE